MLRDMAMSYRVMSLPRELQAGITSQSGQGCWFLPQQGGLMLPRGGRTLELGSWLPTAVRSKQSKSPLQTQVDSSVERGHSITLRALL